MRQVALTDAELFPQLVPLVGKAGDNNSCFSELLAELRGFRNLLVEPGFKACRRSGKALVLCSKTNRFGRDCLQLCDGLVEEFLSLRTCKA